MKISCSCFLVLLALLPGRAAVPLFSADGPLAAFQGEEKFETQGLFGKGRQPNIVVALDGTVLATFVTGEELQVRRSEDAGKTWGKPIVLAKYKHIFSGGGVTVDGTSGDILVFAERYKWPVNPPPPTVYRSSDHGRTWNCLLYTSPSPRD